jgi:hypothetical protein
VHVGCILDRVVSINNLGVIMESKMCFTDGHIDVTVGRVLAMLGFVKRLSCEFRDPYTLMLYFMFPLCARNLNTPIVCGGLSIAHTPIELSVCKRCS